MATKTRMSLKMSASWEMEKSSTSVVPRILHLCLSRLTILHPPEPDMTTLMLAIRMRETSRRVLRSPELALPSSPGDPAAIDLDLHFSVQYAHVLNRGDNFLQILVQRRKKYKNKPVLGYKTLALCNINMAQVLQRRVTDRVIDLMLALPTKPHSSAGPSLFGHLHVDSLASVPLEVDPSVASRKKTHGAHGAAGPAASHAACSASGLHAAAEPDLVFMELFSEDEDSEEFDPCGMTAAMEQRGRQQKFLRAMSTGQRHLKQKLTGFMKRFKNEEGVLGASEQEDLNQIWEEIEELETNSDGDSDVDFDTISLQSTPRPNLRPFFHDSMAAVSGVRSVPSVSISIGGEDANPTASIPDWDSEEEQSVDGSSREAARGTAREAPGLLRKGRSSERLSWREKKGACATPSAPAPTPCVPPVPIAGSHSGDPVLLVAVSPLQACEPHHETVELVGRWIEAAGDCVPETLVLLSHSEPLGKNLSDFLLSEGLKVVPIHTFVDARHTMTRLIQKMQSQARLPRVQLVLIGGDPLMSAVLRTYVEQLASRPHEWPSHFRFFPVPLPAASPLPQLVRSLCALDASYAAAFGEAIEASNQAAFLTRLKLYLFHAKANHGMPIGECMLCKGTEEDSTNTEMFLPFLLGVRLGPPELFAQDVEGSESRSSPPGSPHSAPKEAENTAQPPAPPHASSALHADPLELHLDYWTEGHDSKKSLKPTARGVLVSLSGGVSEAASLCLVTVTKKQKLQIRLGAKRPKESELRREATERISRLICRSGRGGALKVYVDGEPWMGVKFFQLSPSWQTHIKSFPLAVLPPGHTFNI